MNRLLLLACLVLVSASWPGLPHAQALRADPVDSIVAVVEEDVILRSELDRAVATIRARYADNPQQLPPADVLDRQVLETLVLLRLQLQRAEGAGVRVGDAEVEQTIRRLAQQNNITLEQMRAQLARDGMSFDEFRSNLRDELIARRLQQSVVQSRVNVTDTEIDILLASDSLQQGRVRLANLLVAVPDNASQEQIETARTKIEGVRQLVTSGQMDFATAALRYSDAPNALDGGDLGWRDYNEIPPMFASMVQGLKPGEVSPPVRGPSGFHMLVLVESSDDISESVTEYHARGIMLRPSEMLPPAEARERAEELRARIAAGADFSALAREHSDDGLTRRQGGDMGWFQRYAFGQAVGDQVGDLADGELSPVFQSEAGFHIIERLGSRTQDVTEEARRNRARDAIARRKSENEFDRFLRQLRDEAFVEVRLGSS
jgi:peptidyl-prolyl cis-trans isomerase SurA